MLGKFCIVRSRDQGVVCGVVEACAGRCVHLTDARQVHGWADGARTLFEAALRGFGTARISEPVAEMWVLDACGVLPCTPEAEANLRASRWNQPYDGSGSARRPKKSPA